MAKQLLESLKFNVLPLPGKFLGGIILFFSLALSVNFPIPALADLSKGGPFAVVELFTSEGCSSCPAADFLVSKLTAWARQNHEPVYPLEFHVDYWNNLGWRDIHSCKAFSQRQVMYSHIFKDQGIYTPEMIVNGSDAFRGSDQEHLQKDLDNELAEPTSVVLQASLVKKGGDIIIDYKANGFSNGDVINIALVERGLTTEVTAGENNGRTLHHDNVVKEFQTIRLRQTGARRIVPLNKITDTSQASVILFVQDPQTMLIEAAKELDVEND